MGTRLVAVQRYYKGNTIEGYDIQDIKTGEIRQFKASELKSLIHNKKLKVANLNLTSDNRLVLITDNEKINAHINYDGKSDNSAKVTGVNVDILIQDMLKEFDSRTVSVKVKSFNKDTNTFVVRFSNGRVIQNSLEILFKYTIESGYKPVTHAVAVEFLPIAVRFRGKTHGIKNIKDRSKFIIDMNYVNRGELVKHGYELEKYMNEFTYIIAFTLNTLLEKDEKACMALRMFAHNSTYESEDRAADRKTLITSSAITYGIMYALVLSAEDPVTAAAVAATSGTLLNAMIQHVRWSMQ